MTNIRQYISWWRLVLVVLFIAIFAYLFATSPPEPLVLGWSVVLSLLLLAGTINSVRESFPFISTLGLGLVGFGLSHIATTASEYPGWLLVIVGIGMIVEQLYKRWRDKPSPV